MPKRVAPAVLDAALADVPTLGVTGAAVKHGIGKATISRHARERGIETVPNERIAAAVATHALNAEAVRAEVTTRLWEIADKASRRELELLASADLRSVVGARTRAIHDAELLAGRATNRTETVDVLDAEIAKLVEELRA
jgi:hypothetical protein